MQRLKNLSVHEISLVKAGANRKKYLVLKSQSEASMDDGQAKPQPTFGDKLADKFNRIPRAKLEDAEIAIRKARSRVKKADNGDMSVPADDDTQQALRAAFKLLAAHSDQLDADTMADFVAALGIEPDDVADDQADAQAAADGADGDVAMSKDEDGKKDDVIGPKPTDAPAKPDAAKKADDDKEDDDADMKKADSDSDEDKDDKEDDEAKKADSDEDPAQALADDTDNEDARKEGMPDFDDATDDDKDAAMAVARKAYADHMEQRGVGKAKKSDGDGDDPEDGDVDDDAFKKNNIHKSREAIFKGLNAEQRKLLEPIFKAQEQRMNDLEKSHKEMVKKSAQKDRELRERQFVAKAAREYRHLGPAEEVGAGLMRVYERDPDGGAAWELILKGANNRLNANSDGFFGEIGSSLSAPSSDSPQDELRETVMGLVQKSGVVKTYEQAEAEFLNTPRGKTLYSKIMRQKGN